MLKFLMHRMAQQGNYFGDDPPPDDARLDDLGFAFRIWGMNSSDDFYVSMETLFGKNGRVPNIIRFIHNLLATF